MDLPEEKAGVIPNPQWKEEHFEDGQWRLGDTYNTAIGQYGFQISAIQLARATAAIANNGKKVVPHVLKRVDGAPAYNGNAVISTIDISDEHFQVVQEGMRQGVTDGIAQALNVGLAEVAAKTGTAEVGSGDNKKINSWITGFFPFENPRYAFAVVMEEGPYSNLRGSVFVMRDVLQWMQEHRPEYLE